MTKKNQDETDIAQQLIEDLDSDRERLSKFFDKLLIAAEGDPHVLAEPVARIADSLTKQSALRVATLKIKTKAAAETNDNKDADTYQNIGRPFADEEEDGGQN